MVCALEFLEHRQLLSVSIQSTTTINPGGPIIIVPPGTIGTAATVHAETTDAFTAKLGKLPGSTSSHISQLTGAVNWGDGTHTTAAAFKRNADGTIEVVGSHTYKTEGSYSIDVTISKHPLVTAGRPTPFFAVLLGHLQTRAKVSADVDGGVSLVETATQSFTAKVGSFDFRALDIVLDKASIDWGDGKTSTARLVSDGQLFSGGYDVLGTHTYAQTGTYKVHVIVKTKLAGSNLISDTAADFFSTVKVMGKA